MSDAPDRSENARVVPGPRAGAPSPGEKRRRYLRWKRVATLATVVLIVVFAVATVSFLRGEDEGRIATLALFEDLAAALDAHHARVGELPSENLRELSHPSSPYRGALPPEDAWGQVIEYRVVDAAAGTWRLRSAGPDRERGTSDDSVWPPGTTWD